jgi:hypothetical protein
VIYGVEKSAGVYALIMELVEGPTLADRIAQGAIPAPGARRRGRDDLTAIMQR